METVYPYRDLPLLLSGGMDSATLLAAQLEWGARPRCYAYRLGDRESEDLRAARRLCRDYELELVTVPIPTSRGSLVSVARKVIRETGNPRKTAVQCCWTLDFIFHVARAHRDTRLITGAGGIAEDNRKAKVLGAHYWLDEHRRSLGRSKEGDQLEAARRPNLLGGNPDSATETMKRYARTQGMELAEPYSEQPVADAGLWVPWPEMNRPVQKGIACRAFPDFFAYSSPLHRSWADGSPGRYWRENVSLQVDGGVRDWHDTLLRDEEMNPGGRARRVVAIYNRIDREEKERDDAQLTLG